MKFSALVSAAEQAVRARADALDARLFRLRDWVCRREGGHDWTRWRSEIAQPFVGSWGPAREFRYCQWCGASERRHVAGK